MKLKRLWQTPVYWLANLLTLSELKDKRVLTGAKETMLTEKAKVKQSKEDKKIALEKAIKKRERKALLKERQADGTKKTAA